MAYLSRSRIQSLLPCNCIFGVVCSWDWAIWFETGGDRDSATTGTRPCRHSIAILPQTAFAIVGLCADESQHYGAADKHWSWQAERARKPVPKFAALARNECGQEEKPHLRGQGKEPPGQTPPRNNYNYLSVLTAAGTPIGQSLGAIALVGNQSAIDFVLG